MSRFVALGSLFAFAVGQAYAIDQIERTLLLDAVRPVAAKQAGQPVRIRVDRLNLDRDWAVLVGKLVGSPGKTIDWEKVQDCEEDLDRMLWVVLNKKNDRWRVEHIEICASEPPYWYLEEYGGFVWPCGVYAGLNAGSEESLDKECRRQSRPP